MFDYETWEVSFIALLVLMQNNKTHKDEYGELMNTFHSWKCYILPYDLETMSFSNLE